MLSKPYEIKDEKIIQLRPLVWSDRKYFITWPIPENPQEWKKFIKETNSNHKMEICRSCDAYYKEQNRCTLFLTACIYRNAIINNLTGCPHPKGAKW